MLVLFFQSLLKAGKLALLELILEKFLFVDHALYFFYWVQWSVLEIVYIAVLLAWSGTNSLTDVKGESHFN